MSNIEKSVNPKVQNANRLSQFFQIFTLLSLVLIVCGFVRIETSRPFWIWLTVWFTLVIISFVLAIKYQIAAIKAYQKPVFNFSPRRLHTLQVLQTPPDVMTELAKLQGKKIRGEDNLVAKLNRMIGSERCEEFRAIVFKYTKVG